MSTYNISNEKKYQYFSAEKSALSEAMDMTNM